jgi:hypothetical protein
MLRKTTPTKTKYKNLFPSSSSSLQSVSLSLLLQHLPMPRQPHHCCERQSALSSSSTSRRGHGRWIASSSASALFFFLHTSTGACAEMATPARSTPTTSRGGKCHRRERYRPPEAVGTGGQVEGGGHASYGAASYGMH